MPLRKMPYERLESVLRCRLSAEEDRETAELIRQLKPARKRGYIEPEELQAVCRWKAPRAIQLIKSNKPQKIRAVTKAAFSTRSEKKRITLLISLKGVSIPMASALLMLLNPKRYGVIDIRVWQLMYALGTVSKNSNGVRFTFKNWYQFLMVIRHFAKKCGVTARDVERTLFYAHKAYQAGTLYS